MRLINILISDPQIITRTGINAMLLGVEDFNIIGEAQDSKELFVQVESHQPDVIIFDYNFPMSFAVEDIAKIKSISPKSNVLIISSDDKKENIFKALDLGIINFLTKECDKDEVINAIYATAKKEKFFCTKLVDIILEKHLSKEEEHCEQHNLSSREIEIVKCVVQGYTAKEIATKLFLSHHTVNTHRKNIMRKLRIKSTSDLVLYALRLGLISSDYRPKS